MAMDGSVLSAILEADLRVPDNVRRLKRHFDVKDDALAEAFGTSRQTINGRLNSATRLRAGEVAGFARFFNLPEGVLYLRSDEVIRWCLDHPDAGPATATISADPRSGSSVGRARA